METTIEYIDHQDFIAKKNQVIELGNSFPTLLVQINNTTHGYFAVNVTRQARGTDDQVRDCINRLESLF